MDINDSVALVTGGASGLGLATTETLLDAGAARSSASTARSAWPP
jgi:NAD(P)-dependent dehydrogenase (short-subunit alcohol dehydrogenase family)